MKTSWTKKGWSLVLVVCFTLSIFILSGAVKAEEQGLHSTTEQTKSSDIVGDWAGDVIAEWIDRGLATGYNDGTFGPDNFISRAEFMTLTDSKYEQRV